MTKNKNYNVYGKFLYYTRLVLTAKATPGRIPPPAAPAPPPPPPVPPGPPPPPPAGPPAVGGGVPWGTKVGSGGGVAAINARGAAKAAASGLSRNSAISSISISTTS